MEEDIEVLKKIRKETLNAAKNACTGAMSKIWLIEAQAIERVLNELERLQKENEALQMTHDYDVKMIDEVKGEYVKLSKEFNALENEKTVHTCLHCGKDTPLYCENCYQELITKNGELQLENEQEKQYYIKKCGDCTELSFKLDNCISKQKIRDKINKLKDEFDFFAGREHAEWQDGEFDGEVCDDLALQIKILKELLGE